MVMNQVTLLCAESFNDVSLLGALTSCPLLKRTWLPKQKSSIVEMRTRLPKKLEMLFPLFV